jgi:uncharacterized coiled-coil DUF342 family protein
MKAPQKTTLCCLLVLASLALCGCSKKTDENKPTGEVKADENKPIGEVKAEAEKMSVEKLKSMAMTYKEAITAKTGEVDGLTAKLKEIPLTQMLGDEAKGLKAEIDELSKSVSALKERFEVYYNKLKDKGGDLSGLNI